MKYALPTVKKKIVVVEPEEVTKKESTTDPDCGLFVKGKHERCFTYSAQTACDKHGFVLDFEVGAGNLHDGQMFHELYKKMELSKTEVLVVDAGYKTPGVVREIFLSGKIPAVSYTRPKTKDGFFRKSEYVYDEHFNCYLCPQNQVLRKSIFYSLIAFNQLIFAKRKIHCNSSFKS